MHTRKTVATSFMSRVGLLGFVNYLLESENNIRDSMSMEKGDGKRERAKKRRSKGERVEMEIVVGMEMRGKRERGIDYSVLLGP
jgi:hypothetical protein